MVWAFTGNAIFTVFLVSFDKNLEASWFQLVRSSVLACVRPSVRTGYGLQTLCLDSSFKIADSFFLDYLSYGLCPLYHPF